MESMLNNLAYEIRPTPYGGRGAFACRFVSKGSPILKCSGPYAHVIFHKFRREVCAWCFAYAFESGKSKWSVKLEDGHQSCAGAWFCGESCRDRWIRDRQIGDDGVEWWKAVNGVLEKQITETRKGSENSKSGPFINLFQTLEKISPEADGITQDFVNQTWETVESSFRKVSRKSGWLTFQLNELQIDTARFVLDGLCRKAVEELKSPVFVGDRLGGTQDKLQGSWDDFMDLQDNAIAYVRSKPYMLASEICVYLFLKQVLLVLSSQNTFRPSKGRKSQSSTSSTSISRVVGRLESYLSSPLIYWAIQGRDPGNVFGIWDTAPPGQESEMLGWGAYSFGSCFNHDCDPNLRKDREGREIVFYAVKDISPGDELCISYVDGATSQQRNALLKDWFFDCRCCRCLREQGPQETLVDG